MSEPVVPRPVNPSEGGTWDTVRRFQVAVPASMNPGLRPMRGSGLGAAAFAGYRRAGEFTSDALAPGPAGAAEPAGEPAGAPPPQAAIPSANAALARVAVSLRNDRLSFIEPPVVRNELYDTG